ncbi:MAG: SPFH domain-containing protein [Planctomycetota bacterium]|jgi:membrane protease subunit HflC
MNKAFAAVVGLLLLVLLVLFSTTYTVRFHEIAVKTTFGREEPVQTEPGVHFRYPLFIDRVTKYDKRIRLVETPLVETPTADGQSVMVRAFLMWRIDPNNVLRFAQSYPDKMSDADRSIKDRLQTALRGGLGRWAFDELIGSGSRLPQAEGEILTQLGALGDIGVEPVAVGVSQLALPAKATTAVLRRMEATRKRLAEAERYKGNSEAVGIRSEASSVVGKLRAFADQRAEDIRHLGEDRAAELLSQMSENEELAIFLAQLEALKSALSQGTTVFLTSESSPWHLMNEASELGPGHIPQPPDEKSRRPDRPGQTAVTPPDEPAPPATARRGS